MTTLIAGANTVINGTECHIQVDTHNELGKALGVVWLPINKEHKVVTSPAYLHENKDWASLVDQTMTTWKVNLQQIFEEHKADKLQFIIYCYADPDVYMPAVEIKDIKLSINHQTTNHQTISYHANIAERHVKACKVLELYKRNGQYKCRALAEYSTHDLQVFSDKLDIHLDARFPQQGSSSANGGGSHLSQRPQPRSGETWTGTAFAIDAYHLLTCEHVIHGASVIALRQQGQPDRQAQVVMADEGSDSALLKVDQPLDHYLPLRKLDYDMLGEEVTTLGFPLTGISSQLQVTQGCIAGLQGIGNDIRYLQFTAPIQPGSSGSPLILPTGEVVGMVTSSINHEQAQNMNYAVKYQLLSALIASTGLNLSETRYSIFMGPLSTPKLTKQCKPAVWLVGCQA